MEGNNGEKIKIHERLTTVEVQMKAVVKTVDKLSNRFWAVIILLVANLTGIIVNLYK